MKDIKKIIGTTLTASLATGIVGSVAGTVAHAATIDEIYKAAYEATINALASKDQDSINIARQAIDKIPSEFQGFRGEFSKQVDSVQHPILVKIVDAINNADKTGKQVDINAARNVIPAGLPDVWRNSYSSGIDGVQQKLINKTVDAVNAAIASQSKSDIDAARALLDEVGLVEHNDGVKSWIANYGNDFIGNIKLAVDKVEVTSPTTVKVTFSKAVDPSTVTTKSFVAYGTDNKSELWNSSVTVSKDNKSAEIKFSTTFAVDQGYTLEVKDVKDSNGKAMDPASTTFVYQKADVASIQVTKTIVKTTEDLNDLIVVKDKLDRDITASTASSVTFESSNIAVIDGTGAALTENANRVLVTPVIKDSNDNVVFRGNTVSILVSNSAVATDYQGYSVYKGAIADADNQKGYSKFTASTDVKLGEADNTYKLAMFFKDSNGNEMNALAPATVENNETPEIATLTIVGGEAVIKTYSAGTAYFKVKTEGVEKTISINVQEAVKPVALSLDKDSASLITGGLEQTFIASVKNQYGENFVGANTNGVNVKVEVKNSAGDYVATTDTSAPKSSTIADTTSTIAGDAKEAIITVNAGSVAGSATYRVTYEYTNTDGVKTTLQKTFTVSTKAAGSFSGYQVAGEFGGVKATETDKTLVLDKYDDAATTAIHETNGEFYVYSVDTNGSRLAKVDITGANGAVEILDSNGQPVTKIDADGSDATAYFTVNRVAPATGANTIVAKTAAPEGTYTVNVKVGSLTVKSYTLTVKDSQVMAKVVSFTQLSSKENVTSNYQDISKITSLVDQFGKPITVGTSDIVRALSDSTTRTNPSTDGKAYDLVVSSVETTIGGKASVIKLLTPVVVKITDATP